MRRRLVAATLGIAGVGAAVGRPAVALVALVPATVLAAAVAGGPPAPSVSVTRTCSTTAPGLGDRVRVRVRVENEGATMADCLIRDRPPAGLEPLEPPRESVRLPAGETAVLEYRVVARRGRHEFGAVAVTARGVVDGRRVEQPVATVLSCRPDTRPIELPSVATRRYEGQRGETGGSGVEFHAVREYRPADPQRRIDWRRFARTRELSTVEFREDATDTVHILVDASRPAAVRGTPAGPSAVAYCADAAERLATALSARGTRVGVGLYPDDVVAVPPDTGAAHREAVRRLLAGHEALPWGDADGAPPSPHAVAADGGLPETLDARARVLLVSPCLDDDPVEFVTDAVEAGRAVAVLAPDVGGNGSGATVERALRADRLTRLEGRGVPAVDWAVETPLEPAATEVFRQWT